MKRKFLNLEPSLKVTASAAITSLFLCLLYSSYSLAEDFTASRVSYDLSQNVVSISTNSKTKVEEKYVSVSSQVVDSDVGIVSVGLKFTREDYESLLKDGDLELDLSNITGVTTFDKESGPKRSVGSLRQILSNAKGIICGEIIAYGALQVGEVVLAVSFNTPTKITSRNTLCSKDSDDHECTKKCRKGITDIFDDCPGLVWLDDNCNNSARCVNVWRDTCTGPARIYNASCTFYNPSWNPINFCLCG